MQALSSLPLFYKLPSSDPSYWALIEEKLSTIIPDLQTLTNTINFFTEINYPKMSIFTKMDSLYFAIAEMRKQILGFCFFEDILPKLQKCCLEMPMLFKETQCKLKILPQGRNSDLRLSGLQVRCLLSHAFFNTLNTYLVQTKETNHKTSFGNISFYNLYVNPLKESVERMKCLFFYFHEVFNEDPKEDILFLRRVLPQSASPDWKNSETPIAHDVYISHIRKIEDSNAYMHLDFANKNLMIHKIIPSLTQEEILFSLRPALFVSLLVSETIADNEAIFMLGCRRYCTYKGYLRNFEFTGGYEERKNNKFISGIIAIDSVINFSDMQFDENFIERDLNKAYLGFTGKLNVFFFKRTFF